MKSKSNPFLRALAFTASMAVTMGSIAHANQYQWGGATSTDWATAGNWSTGANLTAGPAPTGASFSHRLNVYNAANNKPIYSSSLGTTTYANTNTASAAGGGRGLVIGSGINGEMEITGGTFSTLGAVSPDIIGNGDGKIGTLVVSGGSYIGTNAGTWMNIGGAIGSGRVSNLTVSGSGTATLSTLNLNGVTINVNLNGGTLELNGFTNTSIVTAGKIRLNSGTLKARQNNAAFIAAHPNLETLVQSGGAVIDTNGFDVGIAEPLLQDAASTGGGLTKNSAGLLTLTEPATTTGPTDINAGGLSVKAGAASWAPSSFSHSGDKLDFNLGVFSTSNPVVINTGALTVDSAITVNVTGSNFQIGQIPLINYTSKSITGSLTLNTATLPVGVIATLEDNGMGQIYLNVTQAASIFNWSGATATPGNGDWDTSSLNWNTFTTAYSTANSQIANFPDIAGGGTVSLTASFSPLVLNISNNSGNPYVFGGAGKLTGSTPINKTGTGRATFAGSSHDHSGATTISAGAIVKRAADGSTGSISVTTNGASFALDGTLGDMSDGAGQTLYIAGAGIAATGYFDTPASSQAYRGALQSTVGSNTWAGDIVLTSTATGNTTINRIGVQPGADLTLTGTISENIAGTSLLFRGGSSGDNITLSGAGTYSYTNETQMYSDGGTIILGGNNKLPTAKLLNLTFGGATVFDLNAHNQELSAVYGGAYGTGATITNHGATPSILTVAPPVATSYTSNAFITNGSSTVSIVKNGAGTQILGYTNSYTGTTTVNDGTLLINADQSGATGAVQVNGGVLGGTGTIGGTVTVGALGTIAPGVTLGTLTVNSADLAAGGTLAIGLNDAGTPTADQLVVTNNLDVNGAKLNLSVTGTLSATSYVIATAAAINGTIATANVTGLPSGYTLVQTPTEIRLDQSPASDYDNWVTANGVTGGENNDDDSDGLTNHEEYSFGLDPTGGSSVNPIAVPLNKSTGTFSYTRRTLSLTGLTYSVWYSTDLSIWAKDPGAVEGTVTTSGEVETVPVTLSRALLGNSKLFLQVRAE